MVVSKRRFFAHRLFVFLLCYHIPVYGTMPNMSADSLDWMRVIFASNRGTLMELGISLVSSCGMVMQQPAGSRILDVDRDLNDVRTVFEGAQELFGARRRHYHVPYLARLMYAWAAQPCAPR